MQRIYIYGMLLSLAPSSPLMGCARLSFVFAQASHTRNTSEISLCDEGFDCDDDRVTDMDSVLEAAIFFVGQLELSLTLLGACAFPLVYFWPAVTEFNNFGGDVDSIDNVSVTDHGNNSGDG